jgi:nicotinamide-nucleotide amidase
VQTELRPGALTRLEAKYQAFGRTMPVANRKQAEFPVGAEILPNPRGTAEGFALWLGGCWLFVMPGVPVELQQMFTAEVEPRVVQRWVPQQRPRRVYRVLGLGESTVAERIAQAIEDARRWEPLESLFVHYLPSMPEVRVVFELLRNPTMSPAEAFAALDRSMATALGQHLYGIGDAGLAERLVDALSSSALSVATAESCTGGGVARRLVAIAGASRCFVGSIVAYDNKIKVGLLGVDEVELARHGAVSEPVARAMAAGARRATGADLSVAITGIAGPSGATPEKPVGTVHFAVCDAEDTVHELVHLRGDRGTVQRAAELWALKLLWDRLVARGLASLKQLPPDKGT